jgi:hypothetical protein
MQVQRKKDLEADKNFITSFTVLLISFFSFLFLERGTAV